MSKKDNGFIDKKTLGLLDSIKEKKESGENLSSETEDAVEAIEMASQIIDAIMAGRQLDLAFYSLYANSSIKKIRKARKKRLSNKDKQ